MLITRCPHCYTTFRVAPTQLKAKQGKVRCGHCLASFDALPSLADEAVAELAAEPPAIADGSDAEVPTPIVEVASVSVPSLAVDEPADERVEPAMSLPEPAPESALPDATSDVTEPAAPLAAEAFSQADQSTEFQAQETPQSTRRWPWLAGCLLALAVVAIQSVLHFRSALAARFPQSQPTLAALCESIGCALELPRRIDLMEIESSDLTPDGQAPGQLQLVATLRNKAPYTQQWPYLELTLTDVGDRALVRRALTPAEYLASPAAATEGFAPGGDRIVQLVLRATDTPAVGYRLYLFYP